MKEQSEFDKQKESEQLKENAGRRVLNWVWDIIGMILMGIVISLFVVEKYILCNISFNVKSFTETISVAELTAKMTRYILIDLIILAVIILSMFFMHYRFNEKIWQLEKEKDLWRYKYQIKKLEEKIKQLEIGNEELKEKIKQLEIEKQRLEAKHI